MRATIFAILILVAVAINMAQAQEMVQYTLKPSGGETYKRGQICHISWSDEWNGVGVAVEIFKLGEKSWSRLGTINSSAQHYAWTIPLDYEEGKYRLRIRRVNRKGDVLYSHSLFEIAGTVPYVPKTKLYGTPPAISSLVLHPNPVRGILHVESDAPVAHLTVYDVLGKSLLDYRPPHATNMKIWVGSLPPGRYWILTQSISGSTQTKMFVKQ